MGLSPPSALLLLTFPGLLLPCVLGSCDFQGICPNLKHQPLIPEAKVFISLRWQLAEIGNGKIFKLNEPVRI